MNTLGLLSRDEHLLKGSTNVEIITGLSVPKMTSATMWPPILAQDP